MSGERKRTGRAGHDASAAPRGTATQSNAASSVQPINTTMPAATGQMPAPAVPVPSDQANPSQPPEARAPIVYRNVHPDVALQAYLIRQQLLVGIPPEEVIPMRGHRAGQPPRANNMPPAPPIVQFTANGGIVIPHIPPARFSGIMYPIPRSVPQPTEPTQPAEPVEPAGVRAEHAATNNHGNGQVAEASEPITPLNQNPPDVCMQIHGMGPYRPATQQEEDRIQHARQFDAARHSNPLDGRLEAPIEPTDSTTEPMQIDEPNDEPMLDSDSNGVHGFDLFRAILNFPGLAHNVMGYLDVKDIVNLYAISKDFHRLIKDYPVDFVVDVANQKAPDCVTIFPWTAYRKLCTQHRDTRQANGAPEGSTTRIAPSFGWLSMICYREEVVKDMLRLLREGGIEVPKGCQAVVKKIWFLMDIPDNTRRIWAIRNKRLWPDIDLFFASVFIIRLEMYFELNLTEGRNADGLRRLLMAQPSFTLLCNVLKGTALRSPIERLKAFVRWQYNPTPQEVGEAIFGVPADEVGKLQWECYGKIGAQVKLQRPDALILRECMRRQLDMQRLYMDAFFDHTVSPVERTGALTPWEDEVQQVALVSGMSWHEAIVVDQWKD